MFDKIIQFALRNRLLVIALTAALLVYGLVLLRSLPVDVFPDLNRPTVSVLTNMEGVAPEDIETLITHPLETAINGTPGLTRIFSSSITGLSLIRIEFQWDTNLREARLAVTERLQAARDRIPPGATPQLSPSSSIMGEILMIGFSATGDLTGSHLRNIADWTVRPRLLALSGVSQVSLLGGDPQEIEIAVDPEKLLLNQIGLVDLSERLKKLSLGSSGGFLDSSGREWLIRNYGRIRSIEEISETAVGMRLGKPVLLKDVAVVSHVSMPKRGDASISGKGAVVMMIQKQPGADTIDLTKRIDKTLAELKPTLPPGIEVHTELFRQASFIEHAIGNVSEALRDGSIMVAVVLLLFLLNFRATMITLTALPVSLIASAVIFKMFDMSVNTMTLGGLAIAIGELVDDAIVDVENIIRRLRENSASANPKPVLTVVFEASREVRNSIVIATVIVVLVFVPLFALPGLEGRLFIPIGVAYVVSLLASLIVSLTLTPVMASYLLTRKTTSEHKDTWLARTVKLWDRSLLERTLNRPGLIISGSALLFLGALSLIPLLGRNFLPTFNEGSAMAEVEMPPGTSLAASSEVAMKAENAVREVPEVLTTARRTGRSADDEEALGVNQSEIEIALKKSKRTRAEVFADIREKIQKVLPEGAFTGVTQPISHRIDHIMSGVKSQVALKIYGPDLRILRQSGAEFRNAIAGVTGVVDLRIEGQAYFPQYKIYTMRPDMAKYGLAPGDLVESLEIMLQGTQVAKIMEKDRVVPVTVRLSAKSRDSLEKIKAIPVHMLPDGQAIRLADVADAFPTSGPNTIERENQQRRIVVSFNSSGRDLESIMGEVIPKVAAVELPSGYSMEIDGQYKSQQRAIKLVSLLGIASLLGVFGVLLFNFRSAAIAAQIMVNVPLALIGAVVAVYITDRTLSVASLIAFITLCGIAARNGIMMVSHYIHLMTYEGEEFSKEMIIRGSLERLIPVLMTALSAILGLSPLLFAKDVPGKEILHPVAVVIVGGLVSSTLLDILVTPAIFYRFGRKSAERLRDIKRAKNATHAEHFIIGSTEDEESHNHVSHAG